LNVLMNAVQAIREKGTITVKTAAADDGIAVLISDDGSGIEPDVLPHIFEPFFTTKPVGKGMGLGLTSAYAIVSNHHGKIYVDSKPGFGAAFTIRLPIRQPESATVRQEP
jgi:two-component system NtrC family sensor kinase